MTTETPRYVTVTAAALAMGVPARTVREWCRRGALASRQGARRGKRLIPTTELAAWARRENAS